MKCILVCSSFDSEFNKYSSTFPSLLLTNASGKIILNEIISSLDDKAEEYYIVTSHTYFKHFEDWSDGNPHFIKLIDNGAGSSSTHFDLINDIRLLTEKVDINENDEIMILVETSLISKSLNDALSFREILHCPFISKANIGGLKLSCLFKSSSNYLLDGKTIINL